MGQARELLNRVGEAVEAKDLEALGRLYAPDAVAMTPDRGQLKGREQIMDWMNQFIVGFPDTHFDMIAEHEQGDTAMDEGYIVATNTGPLSTPDGELAPTNRTIRLRECDVVVVDDGMIREHRIYFDQADFREQLGLVSA